MGYADSMDAAVIIIKFEDLLKQMPVEDAENMKYLTHRTSVV